MPNWVENDLYIYGRERERRAAVAALAGPSSVVDFNGVIAMPEFLEFTPSPPTAHRLPEADPMKWPWVQELGLADVGQVRDHIVEKFRAWKEQFGVGFEFACVSKAELSQWADYLSAVACVLTPQTRDWDEWSTQNWGTGCNATFARIVRRRPSHKITFSTAWKAPSKVIIALAEKHPRVSFTLRSFERGFGWKRCLMVKGNKIIRDEKNPYNGKRGG